MNDRWVTLWAMVRSQQEVHQQGVHCCIYIYMDWRPNNLSLKTNTLQPKVLLSNPRARRSRNKTLFTLLSSWLTRPACVMYNWCMVSELVTQWQNVWLPSPSLASSHLHHRGWVSLDLFPSFPAGQMCRWSLREVIKSHRLTLHKTLALNHWKALVDVK